MLMDMSEVKELRKTTNEKEVNFLLSEGWKLVNIACVGSQSYYLLIRT